MRIWCDFKAKGVGGFKSPARAAAEDVPGNRPQGDAIPTWSHISLEARVLLGASGFSTGFAFGICS